MLIYIFKNDEDALLKLTTGELADEVIGYLSGRYGVNIKFDRKL